MKNTPSNLSSPFFPCLCLSLSLPPHPPYTQSPSHMDSLSVNVHTPEQTKLRSAAFIWKRFEMFAFHVTVPTP